MRKKTSKSSKKSPIKSSNKSHVLDPKLKPRSKQKSVSVTVTDPLLQAYLREVLKVPLLSREEERELALHFHTHKDRESFQRLVTSNLRFVVKIAYEYVRYRLKLMDLIQEGNVGLVKAVQEFDPYKEVRLTTYAVWWIRSYIQDFILRNFSLVKLGTTQAQKKLFYRLRKEQRELEKMGLSSQQNVKLLARRLEVTEKEVEEMDQRLAQKDVSLNAPIQTLENKEDHLQNVMDPSAPIDVTLGETEQKELFKKVLGKFSQTLEGRDKFIFTERLISEKPLTLQEVGNKFGFTKERARQIEEQLKARLKEYVSQHFPDYDLLS